MAPRISLEEGKYSMSANADELDHRSTVSFSSPKPSFDPPLLAWTGRRHALTNLDQVSCVPQEHC
jgi:hypothetical protein